MATIGELAWANMLKLTERGQWDVGYSQPSRLDIRPNGQADCSSATRWAYNQTGLLSSPIPNDAWTGNWRAYASARGFRVIPYSNVGPNPSYYVVGDLLLSEKSSGGVGHIAMVGPGGRIAELWVSEKGTIHGAPGDQTGNESRSSTNVKNHPYSTGGRWTHVLRPPGTTNAPSKPGWYLEPDGIWGAKTGARFRQVFNLDPSVSWKEACVKFQLFLNWAVDAYAIRNLTGKYRLVQDGNDGPDTWKVFQYWWNTSSIPEGERVAVNGAPNAATYKAVQVALNHSWANSGGLALERL